METHGIKADEKARMLMIGDNNMTDILFANNVQIDSMLVFTGMTTEDEFYQKIKKDEVGTKQRLPRPCYTMKLLNF